MRAILYVGHGSRIKEANEEAITFIKGIMSRISVDIQEYSFLELATPTMYDGVKKCVEKGATDIIVVPVLLLTAKHVKVDIPQELSELNRRFSHLRFTVTPPLGVHERVIDVLMERLEEKKREKESSLHVLLVGRGSSDKEQINDVRKIATMLQKRDSIDNVQIAFLAAAEPSFTKALEEITENTVYVLPYLLFTGILMKSMQKEIKRAVENNQQYILCNYLGFHPYLQDVFVERVSSELLEVV